MAQNQYITREVFEMVLRDLNHLSDGDELRQKTLLDRATGDLEADLAAKFVVPLVSRSLAENSYLGAPQAQTYSFAKQKVLNALIAKIRAIIGYDVNRNLTGTIESTEKFLNVHEQEYKGLMRDLLDPKIDYGFRLLNQAADAQSPVQHLALSRADNKTDPFGGWGNGWQ